MDRPNLELMTEDWVDAGEYSDQDMIDVVAYAAALEQQHEADAKVDALTDQNRALLAENVALRSKLLPWARCNGYPFQCEPECGGVSCYNRDAIEGLRESYATAAEAERVAGMERANAELVGKVERLERAIVKGFVRGNQATVETRISFDLWCECRAALADAGQEGGADA